jgi:hypothetical protein
VRVRARRLHDGRGVGRRSQQEGNHAIGRPTGQTMPLPPLLREDGGRRLVRSSGGWLEDLSGAGRRKQRKTCVVDAVVRARIGAFPAAASRPAPERRC